MELWILPAEEKIRADGPDWLLLILAECNPEMSDKFMLLLWRTWYVRNQIKPENAAMPTEGSKRFLESYFQSLFEVHQRPGSDLKRKTLARSVDFYKQVSWVMMPLRGGCCPIQGESRSMLMQLLRTVG